MFLWAKTASAATAALGFAGYVLSGFGQDWSSWEVPLAVATTVVLTTLVLSGIRRSNATNIVIVSITILSLVFFVLAGLPVAWAAGSSRLVPFFRPISHDSPWAGFFEACALMFVAYTGYGRIATLGEEIREPKKNIPLAIVLTLVASMGLYIAVGLIGIAAVGAESLAAATTERAAPLAVVARQFGIPGASVILAVGAVTAMLGVLLNLILGLSRVLLSMGRRKDMPSIFAKLNRSGTTPYPAVIVIGIAIAALVLIGNVKTTWSFSAFTVLVYYALTNLSAIRLSDSERLYPRFIPWVGLISYLFLAVWVEQWIWLVGLGLIGLGLVWHFVVGRLSRTISASN